MTTHLTDIFSTSRRLLLAEAGSVPHHAVAFCLLTPTGVFESDLAAVDTASLVTLSVDGSGPTRSIVLRQFPLYFDAQTGTLQRGERSGASRGGRPRARSWNLCSDHDAAHFPVDNPGLVLAAHGLIETLCDGAVGEDTPATVLDLWVSVPASHSLVSSRPSFRWMIWNGEAVAPLREVMADAEGEPITGVRYVRLASHNLAGRTTLAPFRALRDAGLIVGPKRHSSWLAATPAEGHAELTTTLEQVFQDPARTAVILEKLRDQLGPLAPSILTDEVVAEKDWQLLFDDVRQPLPCGPRLSRCYLTRIAGQYAADGVSLDLPELCPPRAPGSHRGGTRRGSRGGRNRGGQAPIVDPLTEVKVEAFAATTGS